ncbi:MAG: VWA domain-containing protein, partial [Planctomycetaceae bacterium]|nr:VWA domain-containing protein [Planctomycetaceae bacterium]
AAASKEVGAYDSAESATKLSTAFLQCVKQLETVDVQDQKSIKALDDEVPTLINAYIKAMTSGSNTAVTDFRKEQQKYRDLMKAEEQLSDRMLSFDRMVEDLLEAIGQFRTREAVGSVLKQAQASFNLRYRARLIEALGSIRTATSMSGLVEILQKATREVEALAAVRGLRSIGVPSPEVVVALTTALGSEHRQIRTTAAAALADMDCKDNTAAIIDALKGASGQTAWDLNESLKKLTGVDKHANADAWKEWWGRNRDAVLAGLYKADAQEKAGAAGSTTTFYGVPVISTAVAFVIDTSGSMWEPARYLPGKDDDGKTLGLKLAGNLKINVAQYELKKVLMKMPVDSTVALVFFDGAVRVQAGGPVRLTEAKRKTLIDLVDGIKVPGGMTNLWGAVTKAQAFAGDAAAPTLKKDGIDTIYALTDGVPTVGVAEAGKFLKRYGYLNRYLQVRVHTLQITVDPAAKKPGEDEEKEAKPLLEGLAEEANGKFIER